jgi:hypothetical protein
VVASRLGTITLTGVNPLTDELFPTAYGVACRDGATGGQAGTVTVNGTLRSVGFADGKFNRNQLSGS